MEIAADDNKEKTTHPHIMEWEISFSSSGMKDTSLAISVNGWEKVEFILIITF